MQSDLLEPQKRYHDAIAEVLSSLTADDCCDVYPAEPYGIVIKMRKAPISDARQADIANKFSAKRIDRAATIKFVPDSA